MPLVNTRLPLWTNEKVEGLAKFSVEPGIDDVNQNILKFEANLTGIVRS